MSKVQVDKVVNLSDDGAPQLTYGAELPVGYGLTGAGGLNITGLVTAASAVFSGNVTIGGTLTYEDVTNIDALGIVTARAGVNLSGGELLVGSNIKLGNAGVVTATSFVGSGANLTGVASTDYIITGTAATFNNKVYVNSTLTASEGIDVSAGVGTFAGDVSIADKIIHTGDTDTFLEFGTNTITLDTAGTEAVRVDSGQNLLLGTSSAGQSGEADNLTIYDASHGGITIRTGTSNCGSIYFADGTSGSENYRGSLQYCHDNDVMPFKTAATEALRIDSSQRLLIGATSSQSVGGGAALTQIQSVSSTGRLTVTQHRNEAAGSPYIVLGKSRGTSLGAVTVLQSGDEIGSLAWAGADGGDMESTAARIYSAVDATPGSNDMPGRLMYATTADRADSPTERLRITSAGDVKIIDGDLIMGTSGNGIDFSATSDGPNATTERFSDYESGTFTPTCANSVTLSTAQGFYVKVGEFVHIDMFIGVNSDNSNAAFSINNLPFAGGNGYDLSVPSCRIASWDLPTGTLWVSGNTDTNSCAFHCNKDNANYVNLPADSGGSLIISLDMEIA